MRRIALAARNTYRRRPSALLLYHSGSTLNANMTQEFGGEPGESHHPTQDGDHADGQQLFSSMAERQYTDEEVAAIFERASASEHAAMPAPSEKSGMTLAALQEIGREVGISAESIALAARSLDQSPNPVTRPFLGMPLGVGLTVELDQPLTDAEWERLVADLRTTFEARGAVRYDGPFRQWTNGNLQALVEPTATGHRVRLQTMSGQSRAMMTGGIAAVGMAAAMLIGATVTGNPEIANGAGVIATAGVGMFGFGALRLRGWVRERKAQIAGVVARLKGG